MKLLHYLLLLLTVIAIESSCIRKPEVEERIIRLEKAIFQLKEEKGKLELKVKENSGLDNNVQEENELELLKSRLERLSEQLKELKNES